MRRKFLLLIGLGFLAFLGISALLARALSANGAEQTAITGLIQAEARGDGSAMRSLLQGCPPRPGCRSRVDRLSSALRRDGHVSVLQLQPSAGFSLAGSTGTARVAWNTSSSVRPIVQCVRVRRAGDVLSGLSIELLDISPRIPGDADCPRSF